MKNPNNYASLTLNSIKNKMAIDMEFAVLLARKWIDLSNVFLLCQLLHAMKKLILIFFSLF